VCVCVWCLVFVVYLCGVCVCFVCVCVCVCVWCLVFVVYLCGVCVCCVFGVRVIVLKWNVNQDSR